MYICMYIYLCMYVCVCMYICMHIRYRMLLESNTFQNAVLQFMPFINNTKTTFLINPKKPIISV